MDKKQIRDIVNSVASNFDEVDFENAKMAVDGLAMIRRVFYGTPLEKVLDDALLVGDEILSYDRSHDY